MTRRSKPLLQDDAAIVQSRPARRRDPAQPDLPFDPMPDRIEPCLALLKPVPPEGPDWVYEIKWDGYRLAVHIEPSRVRIITRGGHDWTHRFPTIATAAQALGVRTAILDGEAVVLDEKGRSDFGALQRSLGGRGGKKASTESILVAFDLLYFDGHDLTNTEQDAGFQVRSRGSYPCLPIWSAQYAFGLTIRENRVRLACNPPPTGHSSCDGILTNHSTKTRVTCT